MAIHILGIRHHGPGSAKNVKAFLETTKPDIILVEGPPEADTILPWVKNNGLKPPVAILCYQPDDLKQSAFYPFAEFSPEWQAILYAQQNNIHIRFMDLPIAHHFAIEAAQKAKQQAENEIENDASETAESTTKINELIVDENPLKEEIKDPILHLAMAAGYTDGEKWWEQMFEHRQNNEDVFEAVIEAMQVLRETLPQKDSHIEKLREAHMRKTIRQAEKEMFQNIAVVCGAWHAPALVNMPKQKEDNELLKGLQKVRVECTWIPWTYSRLSYFSGYGAGIESPGWYHHIWKFPQDDGTLWMAKVAQLFRKKQMDTSVAHVIESVRLANALAALRNLSKVGLEELNESTLSVLCNGENIMMGLLHSDLIVSNKMGQVPQDIPKPPLQLDIEKLQKKLRLPPTADWKDYTLDLRKESDMERSVFLHRLLLLEIKWGQKTFITGKGTFKEQWRLQWQPEFSIEIIDKGSWGNTTAEAAEKFVIHLATQATSLPKVCSLLDNTMPAELPQAVAALMRQINNLAAASGDVIQLMEVIPDLVNISRYGNVRKTDSELVLVIVTTMLARVWVSLPAACTGIDEDAASHLLLLLAKMKDAVNILQQEEISQPWHQCLVVMSGSKNTSPAIAGYSTRLLADYKLMICDDLVKAFYYAMSMATAPAIAAAWLEGFLKGSGTILLIDNDLWSIVNNWVEQLDETTFTQILPLLRRTFSEFSKPERKKLGEKVKQGNANILQKTEINFNEESGKKGIDIVLELFGYKILNP